jgi:proton-dependent oligopeptide transporter, POT family
MALFAWSAGLNIPLTVLIGRNYAKDDPHRDGGYTLYYFAVNLGGFIAPIVCAGLVGKHFGFRWGFVAAAAGMCIAGIWFQWRHRILKPVLPHGGYLHGPAAAVGVLAAIAALLYPTALLLAYPAVLTWAMYILMGMLVLYFVLSCIRRRDRVQTRRYLALLLLFIPKTVFWAFSFQGVTSLNFFARDYVKAPFHYTLFQSANPLDILIFAPLLALLWPWLDKRGKDPSSPRKFGIALLLVALSYGLMTWAIRHVGADGKVGWWILVLCYLVQTVGELSLAPIGYGLVGQLAAPEESSLAMGGWFFGYAIAYQLSGWIAVQTTPDHAAGALGGIGDYAHVYGSLFWIGLAVAAVYLAAAPWIRRLMHGVR